MGLSNDLISQFVKATNDDTKTKKETILHGTAKIETDGTLSVQFDGTDTATPASSTVGVSEGDRVIVMIKNHTATVTGNLSDPSAAKTSVLSADKLEIEKARIDALIAEDVRINGTLNAYSADIATLVSKNVTIDGKIKANEADISDLKATKLSADSAEIRNIHANIADLDNLKANKVDILSLDTVYANIDFSNIGKAAIEHFYATSGLIENVVVGDGTISGTLVGVTIKGDTIEGNSIIADKLVIRGEDGLYYKLNTDGMVTEAEQTEYNSLNGSVIAAKSITATKISVSDLVAFDATIGGFTITDDSIYSDVKDSEGNTTRGIHLSADGQVNFGDETNFIKYYRDEEGNYQLVISAASILYALNGKQHSIADLGSIGEYVHIGTYEDEPCIELGELDSDFRLVITNTRILFMEGSSVPAYITNQSLHITKAVIEEEIQQGEFVWKVRANGNLGLMWKGATE